MPQWLLLVLLVMACYRLTRLVVKDDFPPIARPREWITGDEDTGQSGHGPFWLRDLVGCPWCVSGWIAAGLVGVSVGFTSVPLPGLWWAAVWSGGAWVAHHERPAPGLWLLSGRVEHSGQIQTGTPLGPVVAYTSGYGHIEPGPETGNGDHGGHTEDDHEAMFDHLRAEYGTAGLIRKALHHVPESRRKSIVQTALTDPDPDATPEPKTAP